MPFETLAGRSSAQSARRRHWQSLGVQHTLWQRLWRQPVFDGDAHALAPVLPGHDQAVSGRI
ncbi:hypothetical protein KBY93_03115 [Synechococcus sp. J7-Johnson]|nr:hypothetical protein [Synechococcus sp. J7-Johnson]